MTKLNSMQRELCGYLSDVSSCVAAIRSFTAGLNFESFSSNDLVLTAVVRKFEIIGEALKQSTELYPDTMASISEIRAIIGQRNRIAHGYFDLDALVFWQSIDSDLPMLLSQIRELQQKHCK